MTVDTSPGVEQRLTTVVGETLGDGVTLGDDVDRPLSETEGGYRIGLADRRVDLERRDGPAESVVWIITLRVDGETVGKFGPYASTEEFRNRLETVLTSDVFYTVCCDG